MNAAPVLATSFSITDAIRSGLHRLEHLPAPEGDITFHTGDMGYALLYAYAHRLTGEDRHWDALMKTLDATLARLQSLELAQFLTRPGLLPNLGLLLQTLQRDDIVEVDLGEETLAQFDDIIYNQTLGYLRTRNIDMLYGATGALHYLSTRAGRPQVLAYLRKLFDELMLTKIEDERGIRFFNSHINFLNGNTDVNMGLAHGHCGLLLVLLQLHDAGVLQAEISALASSMVDYLLGLELPPEPELDRVSWFPARHQDALPLHDAQNRQAYNNRMGWCYGDLNVVQVLYQAQRVLHRPELTAIADRVGAHACGRRSLHASGIDSAHLCHGSVSLVLYYRRLYQLQPLPCYREARQYWLDQTLDQLPATFEQAPTAFKGTSLLMGLPGVLLVLISEALDEPLAWPELFLL